MSNFPREDVLLVIGSLAIGGAERQTVLLATEYARRGLNVTLFCLDGSGPLRSPLEAAGVRVIAVSGVPTRGMLVLAAVHLFGLVRLVLHCARRRPRVLHAVLPRTNLLGAIAGRLTGIRAIVTSKRALGTHQDRYPAWVGFDRLADRLSTVVTANSEAVREDTVRRDRLDPARIRVIRNGLSFPDPDEIRRDRARLRAELGLSRDDVAVVLVANLIPYKGHAELIRAAALIGDPRFRLILVGEDRGIGPGLDELAAREGVDKAVIRLGRRGDVPRILGACDIGVMASHEEGFSNALLEKLAAGLPIVATAVGGNPEALADMPGCLTVRAGDAPAMARGLTEVAGRLSEDAPDRATRIRLVLSRYSVESMVDAYLGLHAEISRAADRSIFESRLSPGRRTGNPKVN